MGRQQRLAMQGSDFSIVIPVYNEEKILRSSLADLRERLQETGHSYQIILAENGSRDRTAEIGREQAEQYPEIQTFSYPEPNYGGALREGILRARGEFVVCERPLPELRTRLHVLADGMLRHQIQCLVFQRGMTRAECGFLAATLSAPADAPGRVREHAQAYLNNVLLRFAGLAADDSLIGAGAQVGNFVPYVLEALINAARALAADQPVDKLGILAIANQQHERHRFPLQAIERALLLGLRRVEALEERDMAAGESPLSEHEHVGIEPRHHHPVAA